MEKYRAYVIGPDGHIINRVDIRCPDEKEARRLAKIAVDGHAVELWQTDRFIERFEPERTHKTGAVDPQANSTGAPNGHTPHLRVEAKIYQPDCRIPDYQRTIN